jgi:hypothetical protein
MRNRRDRELIIFSYREPERRSPSIHSDCGVSQRYMECILVIWTIYDGCGGQVATLEALHASPKIVLDDAWQQLHDQED